MTIPSKPRRTDGYALSSNQMCRAGVVPGVPFPSPLPSPLRKGRGRTLVNRSANRPRCEPPRRSDCCSLSLRAVHSPQFLYSFPQSRRDCVLQPRVASSELPWVNCVGRCQPQRGCGLRSPLNRHNPVGVDRARVPFPRVARCSQPWALSRNPVGIRPPDSSSCGERSAQRERVRVRGNGTQDNPACWNTAEAIQPHQSAAKVWNLLL